MVSSGIMGLSFFLIYIASCRTDNIARQRWTPWMMYMATPYKLLIGSKEEDIDWKGQEIIIIRFGITSPYIIPYPFQPISSSLLPFKRYICIFIYCSLYCIYNYIFIYTTTQCRLQYVIISKCASYYMKTPPVQVAFADHLGCKWSICSIVGDIKTPPQHKLQRGTSRREMQQLNAGSTRAKSGFMALQSAQGHDLQIGTLCNLHCVVMVVVFVCGSGGCVVVGAVHT